MPTTIWKFAKNGAADSHPGVGPDTRPTASFSPKIWRVIEHLGQSFSGPVTLHTAAAVVGLHPDYLSRRFKRETGVGFHEYVLTLRLRQATTLLATSTKSIKEIGYEVGFRAPEVFSKAFKRVMGCSPVTYRSHNVPRYEDLMARACTLSTSGPPVRSMGYGDHAELFDRLVECWEDA